MKLRPLRTRRLRPGKLRVISSRWWQLNPSRDRGALRTDGQRIVWLPADKAYFSCLTEERQSRAVSAYQNAFNRVSISSSGFIEYLLVYRHLSMVRDKAEAVLQLFGDLVEKIERPAADRVETRLIVFAGHIIDEAGQSSPALRRRRRNRGRR